MDENWTPSGNERYFFSDWLVIYEFDRYSIYYVSSVFFYCFFLFFLNELYALGFFHNSEFDKSEMSLFLAENENLVRAIWDWLTQKWVFEFA